MLDILSAGKRDLNEENVSSLLAWLLDPGQSHGCGSLFLTRLLRMLDDRVFEPWISGFGNSIAYRQLNSCKADVLVEQPVEYAVGKKRDVDVIIMLTMFEKTQIVAIENKIRAGACDFIQLKQEYDGLVAEYPEAEINFVYLTPSKANVFQDAFRQLPDITKTHLSWTRDESAPSDDNFASLLRSVLHDDAEAKIAPISQELRFVLKSFIVFAENGFRSQSCKGGSVTPASGTRYYKGIVTGLKGLKDLSEEQGNALVGFIGGISALDNTDLGELENRPFKWDDNLGLGKVPRNWIPIKEVIRILEPKGLLCET